MIKKYFWNILYYFWLILTISITIFSIYHFFIKKDESSFRSSFVAIDTPLSEYEINALFPDIEKDWEFVQTLAYTRNLRLPEIYYQTNDNYSDMESDGTYYQWYNLINIDRSIFATTTVEKSFTRSRDSYMRYVLLHEMYHAASYLTKDFDVNKDNHCFMVDNQVSIKIGRYIGDPQLGESEQNRYKLACDNKKNK